jgi:hypothetical protein
MLHSSTVSGCLALADIDSENGRPILVGDYAIPPNPKSKAISTLHLPDITAARDGVVDQSLADAIAVNFRQCVEIVSR